VSAFVDKMLLQLSDPAHVAQLVAPASDPARDFVRSLFSDVYDLPGATLHSVKDVTVVGTECERPLFPPKRTTGRLTQTSPAYVQTDVVYEGADGLRPHWIDAVTELRLTVVLEVDPGEVESVLVRDIDDFATLDQFRAKFRFIDLDEFMREHEITTLPELKAAFHYLLAEIRLKAPAGPFDPDDPANERRFALKLAVFLRDAIDVAASLRDVKLAVEAVERAVVYHRDVDDAEVRTPYALVLVLPQTAVGPGGFTEVALRSFFAGERVRVLFTNP
jgi:hypothetical protein